jgi:hypothetical protein
LTIPYGIIAQKYGARFVLVLSISGVVLGLLWTQLVCSYQIISPHVLIPIVKLIICRLVCKYVSPSGCLVLGSILFDWRGTIRRGFNDVHAGIAVLE